MATFMRALRDGNVNDGVLVIDCDPSISYSMGFPPQKSSALFLLRDEYVRLWDDMKTRHREDMEMKQIIVGTAGIGKSLFRYYLCRKWLLGDEDMSCFKDVRFNIGDNFFLLEKSGQVRIIPSYHCFRLSSESLVLLDPCTALTVTRDFDCRLLIVTTSPSPLAGKSKICNLSQFAKIVFMHVMKMWTRREWNKICPVIDEDHFAKFSFQEGGETYCVPRWLALKPDPSVIDGHIQRSFHELHARGLRNFILNVGKQFLKSAFIPYRLCKIFQPKINDWSVSGFLSDYIAEIVLRWAEMGSKIDEYSYIALLRHPWSGGLLGNWYESWAFDCLENKKALIVYDTEGKQSRFHFASTNHFDYVPKAKIPVFLQNTVLNRPNQGSMPSIDGYGVIDNCLVMIQYTVSPSHSAALWSDVGHLVQVAREQAKVTEVFLVYVVPVASEFTIPYCETLSANGVTGFMGMIDGEFLPKAKELLGGPQESDATAHSNTERQFLPRYGNKRRRKAEKERANRQ